MAAVQAKEFEEIRGTADHPRLYEDKTYRYGFLGTVGDFQKAGALQDVVLEVENRRFPCHRLVLSAASSYFRAMFTSGMAESRQKTVILQGLHPDMLEEILSYIYSGTLHVSLDKVQPLYQAADLLQVDFVRETCYNYMAMNVEHSTCLDMFMFADAFSIESLKDRCLWRICRYFEKVSMATTDEFCSLSVNQLTEIISHDGLDIKEETTVWEAVVRWVEHSREDRRHHLPSILPHIRFNLMTSHDTAAIFEHSLVKEDPGSSEVIRNVVQRKGSKLKMRAGMDTQEMVLLFSDSTNEMLCMNPRVERYVTCTTNEKLQEGKVVATTVASNNDMYVMVRKTQLSLLVYNHFGNVWEHQSSVCRSEGEDSPDHEHLVEVDGHLYYLTNIPDRHYHGDGPAQIRVRRYDRHTDQWQKCSQTQLSRRSLFETAVSCGPHLYLITNGEMHRYHPSEDLWSKVTTPNHFPDIRSAVVTETEIFCEIHASLGGIIVYDTKSDSWLDLPSWEQPDEATYQNLTVDDWMFFVIGSQLHVLLKHYGDNYTTKVWQICALDRVQGVWTDIKASLPSGDWWLPLPMLHVARMYLPCLNANSTDVRRAENP